MFQIAAVLWLVVVGVSSMVAWRTGSGRPIGTTATTSAYWLAALASLIAGAAPLVPSIVGDAAEPAEFSADRAQAHIEKIAERPHPIGTSANAEVREYLATQLRELGLTPEFQTVSVPDWYGNSADLVPVVNLLARIEGSAPTGAVALVAHYDTVPTTPGANDNASGVAVVVEAARALMADEPLRNDVILLLTDGEEPAPRFGSTAFVERHRWFDDVRFVVNLEAIGSGGPSLLTEVAGPQSWVLDRYVEAIPEPAAFSFLTDLTATLGGSNTDFAPFRDAEVSGVEFVYALGSPIYHTDADVPDTVSRRSLHAHGANTLALARELASVDLTDQDGHDAVFFNLGSRSVISYPAVWSTPFVLIVGAVIAVALRRRADLRAAIRSAGWTLGAALLAGAAAIPPWMVLAGWRSRMGVAESYAYLAGLIALIVAAASSLGVRSGTARFTREGVLIVWWAFALVSAVVAPGTSYLFVWPALLGAIALSIEGGQRSAWLGPAAATVGAAIVLMTPAIDLLTQFAQPRPGNPGSEVLPTIGIPAFLIALVAQLAVMFGPSARSQRELHDGVGDRARGDQRVDLVG